MAGEDKSRLSNGARRETIGRRGDQVQRFAPEGASLCLFLTKQSRTGQGLADDINSRYRMRAAERERGVRPGGLLRIKPSYVRGKLPALVSHLPGGN
jgi:hypothetical protein